MKAFDKEAEEDRQYDESIDYEANWHPNQLI